MFLYELKPGASGSNSPKQKGESIFHTNLKPLIGFWLQGARINRFLTGDWKIRFFQLERFTMDPYKSEKDAFLQKLQPFEVRCRSLETAMNPPTLAGCISQLTGPNHMGLRATGLS